MAPTRGNSGVVSGTGAARYSGVSGTSGVEEHKRV